MSLLDQLWDDTVAGPPPENGLGKLRKSTSANLRSASGKAETERANGEDGVRVTRSIMIMKPSGQTGSAPVSPAGSTPPVSPFAGGSGREAYRFRRRSLSDVYEKASGSGPRNPPPPYDM